MDERSVQAGDDPQLGVRLTIEFPNPMIHVVGGVFRREAKLKIAPLNGVIIVDRRRGRVGHDHHPRHPARTSDTAGTRSMWRGKGNRQRATDGKESAPGSSRTHAQNGWLFSHRWQGSQCQRNKQTGEIPQKIQFCTTILMSIGSP